ncbi:MAG: FAD:protein FMN transferase [Deltaproteobacteria bacterium]|nr:FAD:protein FMN transferase [Deltaproteobacteria bacterium]MBW2067741.1 FAD:protein FMN transferase [Deltaproteobacteria bacterium]
MKKSFHQKGFIIKRSRLFTWQKGKSRETAVIITIFLVLSLSYACANRGKEEIFRRDELLMDTVVSIQVVHSNPKEASRVLDKAFAFMKKLSNKMNSHNRNSEIAHLNARGYPGPFHVSDELFQVIEESVEVSRITGGAFDITVGPLLELWPIYRKNNFKVPDQEQLMKALKLVGWQYLKLDPAARTVRFQKKGMKIDLGGIAKGFIVDRTIEFLKKMGIRGALINAGGDIYAMGKTPSGDPWKIGVRHPRDPDRLIAVLGISDGSVVTSGDYERYITKNGVKYTHVVDPRTGFTVQKTASVTIIGNTTAFADALATAMMVLGPDDGYAMLVNFTGIEGLFISEQPGITTKDGKPLLRYRATPGFVKYALSLDPQLAKLVTGKS